jgi:hypothetical protein
MNEGFKPSPDFVAKVMKRVYAYEAGKIPLYEQLISSRPIRYVLACGGTLIGVFGAVPVF